MPASNPIAVMRPSLPSLEALSPYIRQIDESGLYSNLGPLVLKLEARLARRFGVEAKQIVTTSNGTAALEVAFLTAKTTGRYCLMPSWTFVATAHAARSAGLEPYFLDVDPHSQQLSPDSVGAAIKEIGKDAIGAIALVSPFGAPIDAAPWEALQDETGLPVIVDAAAGFVTARASRLVSCLSLHATKILPAGEGGFILCPDLEFAADARPRTNFGFWNNRNASRVSTNAKMSEYHAAIAHAALDDWAARRNGYERIAQSYADKLAHVDGVSLPEGFGRDWFNAVIVARLAAPEAQACQDWFAARSIHTRAWWGEGCHTQTAFSTCPRSPLTATAQLAAETIGLPCHLELDDADIACIVNALAAFLDARLDRTGTRSAA